MGPFSLCVDRYLAIMFPLRPRLLGKLQTLGVILLIWLVSAAVSCPSFLVATTTTVAVYADGNVRMVCQPNWDAASDFT